MSQYHSFPSRRVEPPYGSGAPAIRSALLRGCYANMVMRMNVANCSPDIHAHAEAEQAFDLFFDGIEEEMTRLPPCTEGIEWDNRRKQLLSK
jgi:hypothetical protein